MNLFNFSFEFKCTHSVESMYVCIQCAVQLQCCLLVVTAAMVSSCGFRMWKRVISSANMSISDKKSFVGQ